MSSEILDLLLGELSAEKAEALRARLAADPALAREHADLAALFSLLGRGEEIEPSARLREAVFAELNPTPGLLGRVLDAVESLPGLLAFRFRRSLAFRVATISVAIHAVALGVLLALSSQRPLEPRYTAVFDAGRPAVQNVPIVHPGRNFVMRLRFRSLPHESRLEAYGVPGQAEAIRTGLDRLAKAGGSGSFGDYDRTAYAALAFLAEGQGSRSETSRGRLVRTAVEDLLAHTREQADSSSGAALSALVEDYALSYRDLSIPERERYVRAVLCLIERVGDDPAAREGLALAAMASFPVPADRKLGPLGLLLRPGARGSLLSVSASRVSATAVLARGQTDLERKRVLAWVRPLFRQAMQRLQVVPDDPRAILTLQAPYRL